jgi:hypothetical protein
MLRCQLASLASYRPNCDVVVSVCYDPSDALVAGTLDAFAGRVHMRHYRLPAAHLGRRSIGRNQAAITSLEDIVWFTDCDHCFGAGCLDWLHDNMPSGVILAYPKTLKVSDTLQSGDKLLAFVGLGTRITLDSDRFPATFSYNRAIGGVQIVYGTFAREHGYLRSMPQWQRPTDRPFADFGDDVRYRRFCSDFGKPVTLEIPEVYRIRHTANTYLPAAYRTRDWENATVHQKEWRRILHENIGDVRTGTEVGVWKGAMSAYLLAEFPNLRLLMVDAYEPYGAEDLQRDPHMNYSRHEFECAKHEACAAVSGMNYKFLMTKSDMAAGTVMDRSLDFVFIDAKHDYDNVKSDILHWLPKVRPAGIIGGHDYGGRGDRVGRFGVKRAVDEMFGEKVNVARGLVWWVKVD